MGIRTIIFRGKRKDNGEWVYGGFMHGNERKSLRDSIFVYDSETQSFNDYEIDSSTIGQYTGLTDKNGVRIFEGDIVERVSDGERAVISWLKYSACFGVSFDGWCCGFDNYDDNLPSDFEVIGNIHDNPELLEGGEGE